MQSHRQDGDRISIVLNIFRYNKVIGHISLDSAYAERYMGLPNVTGNYKGYEEADVNLRVEQLRDKMFYLVHGTADDNVHFQQSMTLAKNLANKGVLFRQQVNDTARSCKGKDTSLCLCMSSE